MILTGFGAVLGTVLVYLLLDAFAGYRRGAGKGKPRALGVCMTAAYLGVILWFTLRRVPTAEQRIHLTPLWTLRFWDQADMRWQSYMNVFLFLPLGFLLPWTLNRPLWQTLLIGLALSAGIEGMQYWFRLGLCETDDVICNTIGTLLGYAEWAAAQRIQQLFRRSHL